MSEISDVVDPPAAISLAEVERRVALTRGLGRLDIQEQLDWGEVLLASGDRASARLLVESASIRQGFSSQLERARTDLFAALGIEQAPAAPAAPAAPRFRPDSIFINPEVRPQFTGGEAALHGYLRKNLHLPADAARQHLAGRVLVSFVLSATGLVTYATVVRGPNKILNEEALRLVWHMPAWQPARQHGQPVRVSCTIPINFEEY